MNLKRSVIVKLQVEGIHNFPRAVELFPEVAFLSDPHRHIFHITLSKLVLHNERDVEFIIFKRDVLDYLHDHYENSFNRALEFGAMSCESIAEELLTKFDCDWVEVWEDNENGARIEK